MKYAQILFALLIVVTLGAGINNLQHSKEKLQFKNIELQSTEAKLKILQQQYEDTVKSVESTNISAEEKQRLLDEAQHKLQDLENQKSELERQLQSKRKANTVYAASTNVSVDKQSIMAAAGIAQSDWVYVDYIVTKESGWRVNATNPSSGAYGLCQSLPASKMASAGADWQSNAVTQLRWCNSYSSRYGGWYGSYVFWLNNKWW